MNYRTLLLILFLLPAPVFAQKYLDSLFSIWQDASKPDLVRSEAYLDYIWDGFVYSNPDSAIVLAEKLTLFSKKRSSLEITQQAYAVKGSAYYVKGDYNSALKSWRQSLKIAEQTENLNAISVNLSNIGNVYSDLGNNTIALEFYNRALKISESISDDIGMSVILGNIGTIHDEKKDYAKAMEAYQRSLEIQEELGENVSMALTLNNIGGLYTAQRDFDKALDYYARSLQKSEEIGSKGEKADVLLNIGITKFMQQDYSSALESLEEGYKYSIETQSLRGQKKACNYLYLCHKAMGNNNGALKYLERTQAIDDSLNDEETVKLLQQMEFEKVILQDSINNAEEARLSKEAHQEEVRQKNQMRNILIVGGIFLFLIALGIYARLHYTRKAKAIIEKEKDRSESLLLNILPAEIAAELKAKGKAEARDFDMVSILFTDFKGFTAASAKMSAQDLVREINTCFEAFDGMMGKYNIEKIKTIGDAYMAAGGLPVPNDESVKNTVLAAIEMQAYISKRKMELDDKELPGFEMRVGIHTGSVVAGIVGVKKFAYDIWGDAVNTASRMESSGAIGQINVSQSTYELLKDDGDFKFESRGKVEAKGKGEMEMYFVSKT
jgi:adenylate cyclase